MFYLTFFLLIVKINVQNKLSWGGGGGGELTVLKHKERTLTETFTMLL